MFFALRIKDMQGGICVQITQDTMSFVDRLLRKKQFMERTTQAINRSVSPAEPGDQYDQAIQGMNRVIQNMMKM